MLEERAVCVSWSERLGDVPPYLEDAERRMRYALKADGCDTEPRFDGPRLIESYINEDGEEISAHYQYTAIAFRLTTD